MKVICSSTDQFNSLNFLWCLSVCNHNVRATQYVSLDYLKEKINWGVMVDALIAKD